MTILNHCNGIQPCWGLQLITLLAPAVPIYIASLHWKQDKGLRSAKAKLKLEYYSNMARGSRANVLHYFPNSIKLSEEN